MKLNIEELVHLINVCIVRFHRDMEVKPNVLMLGKKEYELLQSDEGMDWSFRNSDAFDSINDDGVICKLWGMKVCKSDENSMVKTGYVRDKEI